MDAFCEKNNSRRKIVAQSGLFFVLLHELSTASKQQTNTIMAEFIYQEPFPIQDDKPSTVF